MAFILLYQKWGNNTMSFSILFDLVGAAASALNNMVGASVVYDSSCTDTKTGKKEDANEVTVKSVGVGVDAVNAAMAGIQATSRLDGDSILTKRLGTASGVVGLLSLAVKKKPLELGDYFTAASTVISFLGSLGLRLSPLGMIVNIGGLAYTFYDIGKNGYQINKNKCQPKRDDDLAPSLTDAKNACPIILDLNGDGIKTTGIASWRYFDHDQSGFAEQTGWVDKNDGILALDLNGNGKIDDGREIFGNNTLLPDGTLAPHGYAALSQYDSNHDGKIDGHDEIWEKLRVWRDKNEDAKTGKNELHTLDELGIAAINLNAEEVSETDEAGNRVTHRATVTKTDGTTMASADVWFNVNTAQTRYLGDETVSEDIAALPNVRGFGNVPSLHVAMNKDSKLKEMVETYLSTDSEHRDALLPEIIYKWTGSENIVSNSRGRHIDARTLAALERLTGDTFLQNVRGSNPNTNAARILQDEFDKFSRYTEAKILLQKPEYANARSIMDFLIDRADANDEPVNWDLFAQYLSQVNKAGQTEKVKTEYRLIEESLTYSSKYKDSLQNFFAEHLEDYPELFFSGVIRSITGDEADNILAGSSKTDVVLGLAGDDTLEGNAGNDYLNGGLGNDKLYGGAGHDTLDGGTGNDRLYGGNNESDTYLFRAGHGKDVVNDYASKDEQADTLRFNGAKAQDAVFDRDGWNLNIKAYGSEDQVTVKDYFYSDAYSRYNFAFDDASYSVADIRSRDLLKDGLPSASVAATEENPVPQTATDTVASAQTVKEAKAEVAPASSAGTTQTAENVTAQTATETAASAQTVKDAKAEAVPATSVGTSSTEKAAVAQQATAADRDTTATAPAKALAAQVESAGQQGGVATTDSHPVTPTTSGTQSAATASDAKAAAQAQHLVEAIAAFDTRSATADNLATPPLQQPPLAAAAADSTVKPLLP